MRKAITLIVGAVILFSYGVAVGRYELPPYGWIQSFKKAVFEPAAGQAEPERSSTPITGWRFPHYVQKVSIFESMAGTADFVMAGDSITAHCEWNEVFAGAGVVNRGIDGDTSFGLHHRLDEIIARQPRMVFIMIGINDLHHQWPNDRIVDNITDVCRRLRDAGIRPVLFSILYVGQNALWADNADVVVVNDQLRTWCTAQRVAFIDLNPVLAPSGHLAKRFTTDGVHLNGEGYGVWADKIRKHMGDRSL